MGFNRIISLLVFASFISACKPSPHQTSLPSSISKVMKEDIDTTVEEIIQDSPLASLSVSILINDEPPLAFAHGSANFEVSRDATPETIYQIGSITKTFTAASIMRLVEQGVLTLDDPITTFIKGFPSDAGNILLRDLMSHTSGLPNLEETGIQIDYSHLYSPDEIVEMLTDQFPELRFEAGIGFHYSNLGYFLLGVVIEEVTGLDYYSYLQANFFEPMQLENTYPCDSTDDSGAQGYKVSNQKLIPAEFTNISLAYSAGGLCSTASDITRWFSGLSLGEVISKDSFVVMTTPVVLPDGRILESGMGFIVGNFLGEQAIGHIGRTSGYESFLVNYPDQDLMIAILCNTNPSDPFVISNLISTIRTIITNE